MFLTIGRTIKGGWNNFFRNGYLSVAAVSVMLLCLFTMSSLYLIVLTADSVLAGMQGNVNVSMYFKSSVSEESILKAKKDLENYSEIKTVDYITKEKALEIFKKNSASKPVILQSLEEIGENPLLSYLVIQANDPNQYDMVGEYLKNASFKDDISWVNYRDNKDRIDRLNKTISEVRKIGLGVAGLFSIISLLIISNTVRITIYTHRKEVEVMRLVGASNTYIRLPFIFEGIIYGLVASVISMLFLYVALRLSEQFTLRLIPTVSMVSLYLSNFAVIFGMQILVGAFLGTVSSWFAIRKYLKV
ncbi:MAG: permease-like cell division protein FtsX [Candidatus Moraniibacteriota bacterium]|jgi:cell division transport system permease protein